MGKEEEGSGLYSRRSILTGSAALLAGGMAGRIKSAYGAPAAAAAAAPPLPWKWVKLEPLEAGRRAYRAYIDEDGCGNGAWLGVLSLLREKVGYPWTTLPDYMFAHAAGGYGGQGTLCGALGVCCALINLVGYGKKKDYAVMVNNLLDWYAGSSFPTDRFDDISPIPKQVRTKAISPLCHPSMSKWIMAAGAHATSREKKERCAKVTGEVVYTTVHYFNRYTEGTWQPLNWKPKEEIAHCIKCHRPDDMWHTKGVKNQQQGHMDCTMCHQDHTKLSLK